MDWQDIGRVATNTTLAACAAGLAAVCFIYPRSKKWDLGISVNGFLGGLVAVTCPCYWVSPWGAICLGAVAGVVVVIGIDPQVLVELGHDRAGSVIDRHPAAVLGGFR